MVAEYSVWQQGVEVNYAALCEEKKDGLHILRLMGQTSVVYIPQMIDGYEVKVIGEYCFSARNNCKNRTSDNDWEKMEKLARDRGMNELSGDYVEQVILPDSVHELCSYAFYNCRKLKCIEFGRSLDIVNNDAFMNCMGLSVLMVRSRAEEPTGAHYYHIFKLNTCSRYVGGVPGMSNFLKQLNKGIELKYVDDGNTCGSFYYSEYTESYEEIGPAHIFHMDLQGEGYRARQLFDNGVVDAAGYDTIFEAAKALESTYTLSKMAVGRLQYPVKLTDSARDMYMEFIKDNIEDVLEWVVAERRIDIIEFMADNNILDESRLDAALKLAGKCDWTMGSTAIIELGSRFAPKFKKSRYEF